MHEVDIENTGALRDIFKSEQPDIVMHLASLIGGACDADPDKAFRVNVLATKNLALLAHEYKVKKFIFASTAAVYYQATLAPTTEDSNIAPTTLYGKTKLEAEKVLEEIASNSSTNFINFRIFNIYGPGFDTSLVNRLLSSNENNPVQLQGFERFYRDYIHVDDVVNAITKLAEMTKLKNPSIFNIASGHPTSNAELIMKLKKSGKDAFYEITGDQESFSWADVSRAQHVFHFSPGNDLRLS